MNKLIQHGHKYRNEIMSNFFSKIDETGPTESCWNWKGAMQRNYGTLHIQCNKERYQERAHRYSYRLHNGEIPAGMFVCHRCDNPKCVNPHHLFLGTTQDNMDDMVAKRRSSRGEKHIKLMKARNLRGDKNPSTKLTAENVRQILEIKAQGKTNKEIAKIFGVTATAIYYIFSGYNWSHITGFPYNRRSRGDCSQ